MKKSHYIKEKTASTDIDRKKLEKSGLGSFAFWLDPAEDIFEKFYFRKKQ